MLPLDDCLYALQATIPDLTRSSLHRCLERHGLSRLPEVEGEKIGKRKFNAYPLGFLRIDLAEVSIIQLKAALNHSFNSRRVRYVPPLKHKTRDQVTPERGYRLSVDGLAELLDYTLRGAGNYAGHADRVVPLRRYLIAGMCILARPDAIFDTSVAPQR